MAGLAPVDRRAMASFPATWKALALRGYEAVVSFTRRVQGPPYDVKIL